MAKKMNDENNVDKALLEHIKQEEFKNKPQLEEESNILYDKDSDLSNDRTTDLQFMSFDVKQLPCGIFYPDGTKLRVRAAQVREIQAYSIVDENNFADITEKMNDMLQSCVRLEFPDGSMRTFLDLKNQDRIYIILLIRDLTFKQKNKLVVTTNCDCGREVSIEISNKNMEFNEIDEILNKNFNTATKTFVFQLKNGDEFELCPPNIGIEKAFVEYITKENNEGRPPKGNTLSFLKIVPFMLPNRNNITYDGIKSKLRDFSTMSMTSFFFLNDIVDKMKYGIKGLKSRCECGQEVHTDMQFPNGIANIFNVHDAFTRYLKN